MSTGRIILGVACGFVVLVAVSATVSEKILTVPLFEVGSLWVRATQDLGFKIKSTFLQTPDFYSPWTYIVGTILSVSLYYIYVLLFVPLNRVRLLGELGYAPEGKLSQKDMVNVVRKRRKVGDLPPVYPNGWFAIYESRFLKNGQVANVSYLGKNLAVFRSESGEAFVVDAYCPHLGANLAVGGRVFGNCLECPFHGWQFRGEDGKCVKIPTIEEKNIPSVAKVNSYTTMEANGCIFMWHHAEGAEPTWTPPVIEEIARGEWTYRGRTEHIINCHIEEIPENGADVAHLGQVHGPIMGAGIDLRYMYSKIWSWGKHLWAAEWAQSSSPEEKHIGTLKLTHSIRLFGFKMPLLDMNVTAKQIGPGIVHLRFTSLFGEGAYVQSLSPVEPLNQRIIHHIYYSSNIPTFIAKFFLLGEALMTGPGVVIMWFDSLLFGKGAFMHVVTPLEPLTQRMVHLIFCSRFVPTLFAKIMLRSEALMVERDIMIWNNKKYEGKPVYVKSQEDSLIMKHRRWYSQFYSENSPRMSFQKDSLDW